MLIYFQAMINYRLLTEPQAGRQIVLMDFHMMPDLVAVAAAECG
jgi:hypothetical protein